MTPAERQQLIDSLLENDITEADFLRLEAELSIDPLARRDYYNRVSMTLLLENEAAESSTARQLPFTRYSDDAPPSPRRMRASPRWMPAFVGMAIVAAVLLLMVTLQLAVPKAVPDSKAVLAGINRNEAEPVDAGFAVIAGQVNAVWEDHQTLEDGSLVPPGELKLRSGMALFELFSGVLLVVEGEAAFSIQSPMEVTVSHGRVRASVPEPAHGFRIRTAAGEVVDLGTEFAVSVSDGSCELHVLDGEIEWQPLAENARRMQQGEAIRRTIDGRSAGLAERAEDFVSPSELRARMRVQHGAGLERWKKDSEERRHDPRLVAFYQVSFENLSTRRLANRAAGRQQTASDGAIVAAAPAAGRWGEADGSLDFSPAGSRVRLSIPGEHRSMTLHCWVRINSLDRWYNSLFLTDGHDEHEPHWQIMDDGRLFFSVKKRDQFDLSRGEKDKHVCYSPPFWNNSLSGQWLMITTVYDVDSGTVRHFLNGEMLSEEVIPDEYVVETVRIGNASLGNWGLPERDEPRFAVRNLNGSIAEFALFSAALSADEIRTMYRAGKP